MVNVDISNVWTCVSFGDLLGREQDVFDAHLKLRDGTTEGPDFMGWLRMSASVTERLIHGIEQAAHAIREHSDILLVCGCGGAYHGTKAAIEAYCGAAHDHLRKPQIFFVGQSLSGRAWQELNRLLQERDFSLLILSPDGGAIGPNVIARSLRWMMERKYGAAAKERIYAAAMVGTPVHAMAQEEGYSLFPLPKQQGGFTATVTSAALLPMAVAGIDPRQVLEGAVEAMEQMDIRSFENPAWLYAAAGAVLAEKGKNRELLCVTDPALSAFGSWWQRTLWRQRSCISAETVVLPGDLEAADRLALAADSRVFETVLHFREDGKKFPIEMDWRDYDGLGFLSGKHMDYVQENILRAMVQEHNSAGVPVIDVDLGEMSARSLGELFCFFELSAALSACMEGKDPFDLSPPHTRGAALEAMA